MVISLLSLKMHDYTSIVKFLKKNTNDHSAYPWKTDFQGYLMIFFPFEQYPFLTTIKLSWF